MQNFFSILGKSPGKTAVILCAVHGDEICGVRAVEKACKNIKIDSGVVHFIVGNPKALEERKRFIDVNLNRLFRDDKDLSREEKQSHEYKRSREIIPYLLESDVLLDLHSSASSQTKTFAICEEHSFVVAKKLPVEIISSGWDSLEPGGTDYFMNKQGKIGICVECGNHDDPKAEEVAYGSITSFLKSFGILFGETETGTKKKWVRVNSIYRTRVDFKPHKVFADFEFVREGERVGVDGGEEVCVEKNGYLIFCRERKASNEEAFVFAEDEN